MQLTPLDPSRGIYATGPEYIHAILVENASRLAIVSGTMGLDPRGVAGSTIDEQLTLIWRNIGLILRSAGMTEDDIVQIRSYLSEEAFADVNAEHRMAAMKNRAVAVTTLVTGLLESSWLVEIEVLAAGD